ncbi:MAG: glycerate kinase, partial [Bacteroidales bacterium]
MRIVLAIDSFKGCLSSTEAESAAAEGAIINSINNEIVKIPVSDGGEGMLDCFGGILDGYKLLARCPRG